jgi:hypothetical protein
VTNLTAIPITEGFLLQWSWHQGTCQAHHTLAWWLWVCKLHAKASKNSQLQRMMLYKRICGLMIPPSVMGIAKLACTLTCHTGPIHPATHNWRFEKKGVGGNLSLKMLKKHSRWWKNSLSEFQLGFQIRFLKLNWFPQIKLWLGKPLITDDLGFRVLGFSGFGSVKRPAKSLEDVTIDEP